MLSWLLSVLQSRCVQATVLTQPTKGSTSAESLKTTGHRFTGVAAKQHLSLGDPEIDAESCEVDGQNSSKKSGDDAKHRNTTTVFCFHA